MALFLAALGVYGVLSFAVTERSREIGIRIALGAAARDVVRHVLGQTMTLAVVGLTLGGCGALAATRVLRNLLYNVKPADPTILIGAAVLLAVVAAGAAWLPARRASRVDPAVALRHE
jgi:putative ABC transport system permease protein